MVTRSGEAARNAWKLIGPRTSRSRVPCPWRFRFWPGGAAATSQSGHREGRTSSVDGISSIHSLTQTSERTTKLVLASGIQISSTTGSHTIGYLGASRHLFLEADNTPMLASWRPELPSDTLPGDFSDRNGQTRWIRMNPSRSLRGFGYLGLK